MTVELKVPAIGESITEVFIGTWLVKEGDPVLVDQIVVELESDKATVELPVPASGQLKSILKKKGESARIGEVIALIEPGQVAAAPAPAAQAAPAPQAPTDSPQAPVPAPPEAAVPKPVQEIPPIMPSAQRLLAETGISPAALKPSGPGGRLLKEDVIAAAPLASEPEPSSQAAAAPAVAAANREEEIVPMTPMRRAIAQRLLEAQHNAALLTTFNEIDLLEVNNLRKQYRDRFQEKYGVRLGFMSFFVKAVVDALKRFPQLNAEIRGTDIVYRNHYDIGIAVSSQKGLVVPVLRDADRMSFSDIEAMISDFGERAQKNRIHLEELEGGTFTISNGGVFGSLLSTPIVNPPQSGVLGLHAIQDRPVVREGQIVIRPMMYVALTYDHRIVDGREAVTFLKRIKEVIEEPARLMMEI